MGRAQIQWLRGFVLAAIFVIPSVVQAQTTWTQVGTQSSNRVFPTLTTLADGRVLIAGGLTEVTGSPVTLNSVDFNDAAAGTTVGGPPMAFARYGHSAIRLSNGRVLVVGGQDIASINPVLSAEIFNPVTNGWSAAAAMPDGALFPGLALMPNGRVLATGTDTINGAGTGAAIYDPVSNSWVAAASPHNPHSMPAVVTLPNGRVLVVGGISSTTAEIYDPVSNTWTSTAPTAITDHGFGSVYLTAGGRALHVSTTLDTEFYDFATDSWTAGASMFATPTEGYGAQAQLPDGRILVGGGSDLNVSVDVATSKIYDPSSNSWTTGAPMLSTHAAARFATLPNGRLVIAGAFVSPNPGVEMTGPNTAPAANAGPDLSGSTCNACIGGVAVSAAGTIDAEGDAITYIWSLGPTVLATTTQSSVILSLPAGTNVVTLTARDSFGAEGTDTVTITLTNVDDAYTAAIANLQAQALTLQNTITTLQGQVASLQGQVATLTSSNAILVAQLAACQASGGGGDDVTAIMDAFESYLRVLYHDPSFELPGTTGIDELKQLIVAIKAMPPGQVKQLYRSLGGKK